MTLPNIKEEKILETLTIRDILGTQSQLTDLEASFRGKHISILGKGNSGKICPFDADEVWGVNNVATQPEYAGKKIHRLFAFDESLEPQYTDEMKKFAPIISFQKYKDIDYPLESILKEFNTRYFTNTISYMIAYAIYCRVRKISVYGVDVSFGAPYAQENRGVEYWIGRAEQLGIEVYCPEKSHLLRTVYGNLYGEIGHCNMLLYVHERINLINILPKCGRYSDAIKAQNAWWVLFPKEDEARAHGLVSQRASDGSLSFGFAESPRQRYVRVQEAIKKGAAINTDDAVFLKEYEKDVKGNDAITYGEYASDVQMPPEVWMYLRDTLRELEAKGSLPFGLISAYEKLILAKEVPAEPVGARNDPKGV